MSVEMDMRFWWRKTFEILYESGRDEFLFVSEQHVAQHCTSVVSCCCGRDSKLVNIVCCHSEGQGSNPVPTNIQKLHKINFPPT